MLHFVRSVVLLLLAAIAINGCVSEPEIPAGEREDAILDFYMPRTTEKRYVYEYTGFYSGKRDSVFNVDYRGDFQNVRSVDGHSPIHQFTVKSLDGKQGVDIDLYVSDSVVVEYGEDCTLRTQRFVPLHGKLMLGHHWQAAQGYNATESYQISFLAEVVEHYAELEVSGVKYSDVWQVNYEVTGFSTEDITIPRDLLPKARRVIYFARGIGKILEIAYSPDNRMQWRNRLREVTRR
jgi:hypothetical protein